MHQGGIKNANSSPVPQSRNPHILYGQSTTVKSLTVVKLNNGQWRGGTCAPGRPCF